MKKTVAGMFALLVAFGISGCGGGTTTAGGTVTGTVNDYGNGNGISGVTVTVKASSAAASGTLGAGSDVTATTGSDGAFTLSGVPYGDATVVLFTKTGYGSTGKVVALSADYPETSINVDLQTAQTQDFDPTADQTLGVTGSSAGVVVGANTLEDADGNPPSGQVTVSITPIDTARNIDMMPGDMVDKDGKPIESYGAVTIEFVDAQGHTLNLASGTTATVRIPASKRGGTFPATIPFYYFDTTHGYWVQEGTGTLKSGTNGQYYEGTVSHFSTWNGDHPYEDTYIKGCVENIDGTKVTSGIVKMEGVDYSGRWRTYIQSDGNFSVKTKQNAKSMVTATSGGKTSNTAQVQVGSTEKIMSECLVIGTAPIKAKLTWGEHPSDLDTHVIGPNGYHIYWSHKGSYDTNGAYLDVDDVTGYGPEVYSVRAFQEAGTYHYAVYNYSGTHSPGISASPARVELFQDDGTRTVYTPPSGETTANRWWNVFDIIVGADKTVERIVPVNTWTDRSDPVN